MRNEGHTEVRGCLDTDTRSALESTKITKFKSIYSELTDIKQTKSKTEIKRLSRYLSWHFSECGKHMCKFHTCNVPHYQGTNINSPLPQFRAPQTITETMNNFIDIVLTPLGSFLNLLLGKQQKVYENMCPLASKIIPMKVGRLNPKPSGKIKTTRWKTL